MSDFLFRELTEKDRQAISQQAKAIMDSFSQELDSVSDKLSEAHLDRGEAFERDEGEGEVGDSTFREFVFSNAPHKEGDHLIAEKKEW